MTEVEGGQNLLIYFQIEYRAKAEALKLKEKEQRELERKYGKKKAKEVAEDQYHLRSAETNIFRTD